MAAQVSQQGKRKMVKNRASEFPIPGQNLSIGKPVETKTKRKSMRKIRLKGLRRVERRRKSEQ